MQGERRKPPSQAASPSTIPTLISQDGEAGIASTAEDREAEILT